MLDALHHDRSCAVAEEHERRAVGPVEDLREDVAADDERALREAGREHRVRLRDRVDESGAAGGEVVGGRVGHAERVGKQRARRRERHVGRHGRDDEQVDRRRVGAGHLERAPCRGQADVGQRLVVGGDPPLADAGALDDPFVVRVDELLESSSFVSTRSGTWHAETRDRDRGRSPPITVSLRHRQAGARSAGSVEPTPLLGPDREGERSAHRQLAVDGRLHLAAADRTADGLDLALERQARHRAARCA